MIIWYIQKVGATMKSTKKITTLIISIVVLGVLAFQFINGTGPFHPMIPITIMLDQNKLRKYM